MEKIKLEIANCILGKKNISDSQHNKNYLKCNIRNTGFSQLIGDNIWEVRTWYEGNLNKLFYLKKYIEILAGENDTIFIYQLLDLYNQEVGNFIDKWQWKKNIVSYSTLEKGKYILSLEFSNANEFERFFEENFMNFINRNNGIWINERPKLNFEKNEGSEIFGDYYNIVNIKNLYIEIGYDADNLRLFFNNKDDFLHFINQLENYFKVTVEEVEYNCCINNCNN